VKLNSVGEVNITANNNYVTKMQEISMHLFAHNKNKKLKFR